jgi:hypothetical protein
MFPIGIRLCQKLLTQKFLFFLELIPSPLTKTANPLFY